MNNRCADCYDYLHPQAIMHYANDVQDEGWRICRSGCTVKERSVNGCFTEDGKHDNLQNM